MFLYNLIIHPIRQLLEICYIFFLELTSSSGLSVIALSFMVTLCCLPLYIVAEDWQERERLIQKKMRPSVERIKKAFRGDERFMMLSAYYRQRRYHPMMALRSSFGLLVQIPFFIAAYSFLSRLPFMGGFLFIENLGGPDRLLRLGGLAVNVLPVAMTLINCISGAIYSSGHDSVREKVQIYVSALVFLALLYNSPAGLVIYWTMNNLLSLVKNIFYKFKNPLKVLYIMASSLAVMGILAALLLMTRQKTELRAMFVALCILIIASPLVVRLAVLFLDTFLARITGGGRSRAVIFVLSSLVIALLTGLMIPSMLIESEVQEFCFVDEYSSPFVFLRTPFFQALGLYLFWPLCFYALFGERVKKFLTLGAVFLAACALINNFMFTGDYGPLQPNLDFMEAQFFWDTAPRIVLNIFLTLLMFFLAVFFLTKRCGVLIPLSSVAIFSLVTVSVRNVVIISDAYSKMTPPKTMSDIEPLYHLSKNGRNVLVFMQDRLFSPLIDEVFEGCPGLAAHFDGFTFYPNTVSMGPRTMTGVVGVFGGYSYTPAELNRRDTETLQKKHNEAILSMPVNFHDAGFDVTVSDMPYENFDKEPLTAMYEGYPYINREWTHGVYSDYWYNESGIEKTSYTSASIKHNFIMFGIFKTFPPVLRRLVHHYRWWNISGRKDNFSQFIDNYSCLVYFPRLFDAASEKDSFVMIDNLAAHEPTLLQYPDYVPVREVTRFGEGRWARNAQYTTQAGIMLCYARFFDWLKENGLYDNTRIIIVSDHGTAIDTGKFEEGGTPFLKEALTASLIVKDFGDRTPGPDGVHLRKDMTFMTNADTPALALRGIVGDARNPFTNFPYEPADKGEYVKISIPQAESTRHRLNKKYRIPNDVWWTVSGDITRAGNWRQIFPFGE